MQLITSIVIIICVVGFFLILAVVFLVYKYRVTRYHANGAQQWQLSHPHRSSGLRESKYVSEGKPIDLPADRRVVLRNGRMVTAGGHRDPAVTSHWYDLRNNSWLASAISLARREDLKRYNGGQDDRELGPGADRGRGDRDVQSAPAGQDWRPPLRSPSSALDVEKAMAQVVQAAPPRPHSAQAAVESVVPHIQPPEPAAQPPMSPTSPTKRSSRASRSAAHSQKRASQASQTGSKPASRGQSMQPLEEQEQEREQEQDDSQRQIPVQETQKAQLSPQELEEHIQQQRQQYMQWEQDQRRWEQQQQRQQKRRSGSKRVSRAQSNDVNHPRRTSSRSKTAPGETEIRVVAQGVPEIRSPVTRSGRDTKAADGHRHSSRIPIPVGSYLDRPAGPGNSHMPPPDQVAAYDHYYAPQTYKSRPARGSPPLPLLPDQEGSISGVSTGDGVPNDNRLSGVIVSPLETRAPFLDPAAAAAVAAQTPAITPMSATEPRSPLEMGTAEAVPVVHSRGNSTIVQATAPLRTQSLATNAADRMSFLHSPSVESLPFPMADAFPAGPIQRAAEVERTNRSSTSDSPPSEAYGVDGSEARHTAQPSGLTSAPRPSIIAQDVGDDAEGKAVAGHDEKYLVDASDIPHPKSDTGEDDTVFLAATLSEPPTLDFPPDINQLEAAAAAGQDESLTPPQGSRNTLATPEQPTSAVSPKSKVSPLEQRSRNNADEGHSTEAEQVVSGQVEHPAEHVAESEPKSKG